MTSTKTSGPGTTRPAIEGYSIVLAGSFEPKELVPGWFTENGLIDPHAAEDLELEVILPDVCQYKLSWLGVSVDRNRLNLNTNDEKRLRPLRDLAYELLRVKSEVALRGLGINGQAHFPADSEKAWHKIGHTLAPKSTWSPILKDPGLLTMTVQGQRDDEREGFVNVKVEPSVKIQHGIYIDVNDHYQLAPDGEFASAADAMRILEDSFEQATERRRTYFSSVMRVASGSARNDSKGDT